MSCGEEYSFSTKDLIYTGIHSYVIEKGMEHDSSHSSNFHISIEREVAKNTIRKPVRLIVQEKLLSDELLEAETIRVSTYIDSQIIKFLGLILALLLLSMPVHMIEILKLAIGALEVSWGLAMLRVFGACEPDILPLLGILVSLVEVVMAMGLLYRPNFAFIGKENMDLEWHKKDLLDYTLCLGVLFFAVLTYMSLFWLIVTKKVAPLKSIF